MIYRLVRQWFFGVACSVCFALVGCGPVSEPDESTLGLDLERIEGTPTACVDGRDNDGDGLIDCADSECMVMEVCVLGERAAGALERWGPGSEDGVQPHSRSCAGHGEQRNAGCRWCSGTQPDTQLVEALYRALDLLQNHQLLVQNDDGGWDFFVEDSDELRDTSDASPPNTFGAPALGVLDAYDLTLEPAALVAARSSADALAARPIARAARLFPPDNLFLLAAAGSTGFSSYATAGALSHAAEKDYAAALHLLGVPNPAAADVDALPQADLDAVTDEARVQAFQGRLLAAGRGAGLRLYDWGYRLEVARALGDWPYAQAIVAQMGTDYQQLRRGDSLYLMGLAWTLIALRGDGPTTGGLDAAAYGLLAAQARHRLLAQQQRDGLFRVLGPGGEVLGGTLQEQAFVARALALLHEVESLGRQLAALVAAQRVSGAFEELGGGEDTFGQGELLSSLAQVLSNDRLLEALGELQPGGHCAEPVSREPRGRNHTRPREARCFR